MSEPRYEPNRDFSVPLHPQVPQYAVPIRDGSLTRCRTLICLLRKEGGMEEAQGSQVHLPSVVLIISWSPSRAHAGFWSAVGVKVAGGVGMAKAHWSGVQLPKFAVRRFQVASATWNGNFAVACRVYAYRPLLVAPALLLGSLGANQMMLPLAECLGCAARRRQHSSIELDLCYSSHYSHSGSSCLYSPLPVCETLDV